ncbi:MAG TPA: FmdB family zinc ribbon protein [Acidimicrobiales bacterium]|nr:FmdB family zinc ribbon protein [Acidimicrobiales bacterium]
MPTYEYRCKDCGEQLEVVQSFSDDPLTQCPRCSGTLRKVFYTPGISFKGSGFYKTDSRSSSGTGSSTSTASDTSSDGATSSSSGGGGTSSSSGDGGSSGTSASPSSSSSTAEAAAK